MKLKPNLVEKEPKTIEFTPKLADYLKSIKKDDFKDSQKREAMRIGKWFSLYSFVLIVTIENLDSKPLSKIYFWLQNRSMRKGTNSPFY